MLKRLLRAAIPLALVALLPLAALGQAPSGQPIYPVGKTVTLSYTALAAGVNNSADQFAAGWRNLMCMVVQTAHTGTNGFTVGIANKDIGSGNYVTLLTSAAYTTDAEQAAIQVFPGAPVTANVSASAVLSNTQRIIVTVGATSTFTGKVTCSWN